MSISLDTSNEQLKKLKELAKDSVIYGVTNAASNFVGLLLLPIYTRAFSPTEYGVIELISVSFSIGVTISGAQLESGVARYFYEKNSEERKALIITGFILRLIFAIFLLSLFSFYKADISLIVTGSRLYENAIFIALLTIPLNVLLVYLLVILRLENSPIRYGALTIGNFTLTAILNIILVIIFKKGIDGIFLGTLSSNVIFTFLAILSLRKLLKPSFSILYARELLAYSLPIVPTVIISWLSNYLNRFLLIPIVGLNSIGIFSVGVKISSIILFIVSSFSLAWLPFSMSIMSNKNHKLIYSKVLTYYTAILIIPAIALNTFSYEIIHQLVPHEYWAVNAFISYLIISVVFNGIISVIAIGCNIVKKTYLLTLSYLVGTALGIVILLFFTPRIGITGAALAASISSASSLLVTFYLSQKMYYIYYEINKIICFMFIFMLSSAIVTAINSIDSLILRTFFKLIQLGLCLGCMLIVMDKNDLLKIKIYIINSIKDFYQYLRI